LRNVKFPRRSVQKVFGLCHRDEVPKMPEFHDWSSYARSAYRDKKYRLWHSAPPPHRIGMNRPVEVAMPERIKESKRTPARLNKRGFFKVAERNIPQTRAAFCRASITRQETWSFTSG